MVDITSLMNLIGGASGATSGLQQQLEAATGSKKEAITAGSEAEQAAIVNSGIIEAQKHAGQLQAQTYGRQAASSLGTNMSDDSQIVTQLGAVMRQSALDVIAKAAKVNQTASRSDIFGNPAGFAYDLLYGDAERGALEGATTQFDAASKVMQGLNTATQQNVISQNAIAETKTEATLAAQQELIGNQALMAANAAKEKLAGADMNYINMMDSLNARQVQLATSAYNIQAQQEQRAWMRADRELARQDRLDAKGGDEVLLNYYNAGAMELGQATVSSMAGLRALSSVNKAKMDYLISRGAEIATTGSARMASNPLEALRAVNDFNLPLNPAQRSVADKFTAQLSNATTVGNVEEMLMLQGMDPKIAKRAAMEAAGDKKQWATLQRDWLNLKAKRDAEVVNVGDGSNIYAPPALDFLAGKAELDTNPFLSKYIKPMVAAGGGAAFDPSKFLEFAGNAVMEDKMSVSEISDGIVWMASQAALSNNATVNYHKTFGVSPQEKLVMPTTVKGGSFFGNSVKNVNLTDPTAVTSRILDAVSSAKRAPSISPAGSIGASPFGNIFGGSSNK